MSTAEEPGAAQRPLLVIDASVVIKWHVEENHADAARKLLGDGAPALHAPDLMFAEVGSILWKKIRRNDLTEEEADATMPWRRNSVLWDDSKSLDNTDLFYTTSVVGIIAGS